MTSASTSAPERAAQLRAEISKLQGELQSLGETATEANTSARPDQEDMGLPLSRSEYRRYGRQMILDGVGLPGQLKLKEAKLLVIGAGGLGCPVLLYLASAGIGHITVVDHDTVEVSNLHRQVLHTQDSLGLPKALSARKALEARNSSVVIEPIVQAFTPSLLLSQLDISSYDLVLDCSDNARTRYLLNDACVAHGKILVSGAAIRLDGQLICWNLPASPQAASAAKEETTQRGPCYRCVFPADDLDQTESQNCEDEGVLGPVTGVIGSLMATEAIRLLTGQSDLQPLLTLYSAFSNPPFRTLTIKGKKSRCSACSTADGASKLLEAHMNAENQGHWAIESCGIGERATAEEGRVSSRELEEQLRLADEASHSQKPVLLDVRSPAEYSIAALPGSINLPLGSLSRDFDKLNVPREADILTICRRGNDSLSAARTLRSQGLRAKDLMGGLRAWSIGHDEFPVY